MPSFSPVLKDLKRAIRWFKIELERKAAGLAPLAPPGSLSLCEETERGRVTIADKHDGHEGAQ